MLLSIPIRRAGDLACIVAIFVMAGCGSAKAPAVSQEKADVQTVANCIKVLSPPSANAPAPLNAEKFEGVQRRAIKQLESIGPPGAKDAIPALEKFRDSTPNADLKKAAAEALAKIQN